MDFKKPKFFFFLDSHLDSLSNIALTTKYLFLTLIMLEIWWSFLQEWLCKEGLNNQWERLSSNQKQPLVYSKYSYINSFETEVNFKILTHQNPSYKIRSSTCNSGQELTVRPMWPGKSVGLKIFPIKIV